MTPWSQGDVCAHFDVGKSTLKYWRNRLEFPEPAGQIGGRRSTDYWWKGDVIAWNRDVRPSKYSHGKAKQTRYREGLSLFRQLGGINAAAAHARVSPRAFGRFLHEAGEHDALTGALRVLELAAARSDPETAAKLMSAHRALSRL